MIFFKRAFSPPNEGALVHAKPSAAVAEETASDVGETISGAEEMLAQAANSTGEKAMELLISRR